MRGNAGKYGAGVGWWGGVAVHVAAKNQSKTASIPGKQWFYSWFTVASMVKPNLASPYPMSFLNTHLMMSIVRCLHVLK